MSKTSIEWTRGDNGSAGRVWNPTRGCSMAAGSECGGCLNCYAARQALRFAGKGGKYEGLVRLTENGPRWTGTVRKDEKSLRAPLRVRKGCRWFVNSMSDIFHEELYDTTIDRIFAVMALCPHHTFQVLTKRHEHMQRWFQPGRRDSVRGAIWEMLGNIAAKKSSAAMKAPWPLENVWLGVSVEDETTARLRIPSLLATPAAIRWVSYEPALGPINWNQPGPWDTWLSPCGYYCDHDEFGGGHRPIRGIDWVVVGGESGPGARPFDLSWARNTVAQCRAAGVAVFVKQLGARPFMSRDAGAVFCPDYEFRLKDRKGGHMAEWPEDLRVREYPK